jgi:hypothetical protein
MLACTADPVGSDADTFGPQPSGTDAVPGSETGDTIDPSETGVAETGSDNTTGLPGDDALARGGIRIAGVTVNQGVEVVISENGQWKGPSDRALRIVSGRRAMIRAYVTVPDDWRARPIRGVLVVDGGDEPIVQSSTITVEGTSRPGDIGSTFTFGLEADQMVQGLDFQVQLSEVDDASDLPESDVPPIDPPEPELIGIEGVPMKMRVVMVPVRYSDGYCNNSSSVEELADDSIVQSFRDALYVQNPVQDVEVTVHPTEIDFTDYQQGEGFARLLSVMQGMRVQDNAPPDVHYYALLDKCGNGTHDGAGGYGYLGGNSIDTASQRVSAGLWCPGCGSGWSEYTFTHEVGHSQGMNHVGCGTQGHLPHPSGEIGLWGFDVLNIELHHPTSTYEYMSYCSPTWVSDWTWNYTWGIIQELTSWENAYIVPGAARKALFGLLLPNGDEVWTEQPGRIEPKHLSEEHRVEFYDADGELVASMPARVGAFELGETRYINADIPEGEWVSAEYVAPDGGRRRVPVDSLGL